MIFRRFEPFFPPDEKAPLVVECFHRVRFDEVDALGVVWCGHYASFFEQGRDEWGRKYKFRYQDMMENGFVLPIVQSYADHYHSLQYDELIRIRTYCHWTEAAKMNFSYEVYTENKRLTVRGYTIHAYTDLSGELIVVRPEFAEKFFQQWDQNLKESCWRSPNAIA